MSAGGDGPVSLEVPLSASGQRLDRFLSATLPERSRSMLARWIHEGRVSVDGTTASKPRTPVKPGSRITVDPPTAPATMPLAESIDVTLLYQDDDIAVIDKPVGLVVHPGHGQPDGTLVICASVMSSSRVSHRLSCGSV